MGCHGPFDGAQASYRGITPFVGILAIVESGRCRHGRVAATGRRQNGNELVKQIVKVFLTKPLELGENAGYHPHAIAIQIVIATIKSNAFNDVHGNADCRKEALRQTGFIKQ